MPGFRLRGFVGVGVVGGCKPNAAGTAQGASRTPPPPLVTAAAPVQETITDYREYTGRTSAVESVEIRARVSGYLQRIAFTEGQMVEKDQLLFQIDPRPYQQALSEAQGNLNAAQARFQRFSSELERANRLLPTNSISQAEVDIAAANRAEAAAQVTSLQAAIDRANLDLEFTEIKAPITGRAGRALITVGNLVSSDTTILTSIVSLDPMYAYFDIDEASALNYRQRIRENKVASARDSFIPIELGLANEENHPHQGFIDFVDNQTDPTTGNITVRGRFPNADGTLVPGLFARIKIPFTRPYDALLVPEQALAMDQQGRYLLIVKDDLTVEQRRVVVGSRSGNRTVISEGLEPNDRVVVRGVQKARPGAKVQLSESETP